MYKEKISKLKSKINSIENKIKENKNMKDYYQKKFDNDLNECEESLNKILPLQKYEKRILTTSKVCKVAEVIFTGFAIFACFVGHFEFLIFPFVGALPTIYLHNRAKTSKQTITKINQCCETLNILENKSLEVLDNYIEIIQTLNTQKASCQIKLQEYQKAQEYYNNTAKKYDFNVNFNNDKQPTNKNDDLQK